MSAEGPNETVFRVIHSVRPEWLSVLFPKVYEVYRDTVVDMECDILKDKGFRVSVSVVQDNRAEFVGTCLNKFLYDLPAFVYTYGGKACDNIDIEKQQKYPCLAKSKPLGSYQLITENFGDSETLREALQKPVSYYFLLGVLLQVVTNLAMANKYTGFVHGNLSDTNVLIEENTVSFVPFEGRMYSLAGFDVVKIVDYSKSSIIHNGFLHSTVGNREPIVSDILKLVISSYKNCHNPQNRALLERYFREVMNIEDPLQEIAAIFDKRVEIPQSARLLKGIRSSRPVIELTLLAMRAETGRRPTISNRRLQFIDSERNEKTVIIPDRSRLFSGISNYAALALGNILSPRDKAEYTRDLAIKYLDKLQDIMQDLKETKRQPMGTLGKTINNFLSIVEFLASTEKSLMGNNTIRQKAVKVRNIYELLWDRL